MSTLYLSGLGIRCPCPAHYQYTWHGRLADCNRKSQEIIDSYDLRQTLVPNVRSIQELLSNAPAPVNGACLMIPFRDREGWMYSIHTMIWASTPPHMRRFVRAHEETHALIEMNQLGTLIRKLTAKGIYSADLAKEREETICDIGGLSTFLGRGVPNQTHQFKIHEPALQSIPIPSLFNAISFMNRNNRLGIELFTLDC